MGAFQRMFDAAKEMGEKAAGGRNQAAAPAPAATDPGVNPTIIQDRKRRTSVLAEPGAPAGAARMASGAAGAKTPLGA